MAELIFYITYYRAIPLTVIAIRKEWIPDYVRTQLFLQIVLFVSTLVTTTLYAYDATKEPENCTDFCQKLVKTNAEEPVELHRIRLKIQRAILTKELTKLEKLLKKVEKKNQLHVGKEDGKAEQEI